MSQSAKRSTDQQLYRLDIAREALSGILEAGWMTFSILVAIRFFEAGEGAKALLAASPFIGMAITPVTLPLLSRRGQRAEVLMSRLYLAQAAVLALAVCFPSLPLFVVGAGLSFLIYNQRIPLLAQIYSTHYSDNLRGRRVGTSSVANSLLGVGFALIGGTLLDNDLANYRYLFGTMVVAAILAAFCAKRYPSTELPEDARAHPLRHLGLLRRDLLFTWMVTAWALVGGTMVMCIPIRSEYLANEAFGLNFSNSDVSLMTFALPALAYTISVRFWGIYFDKVGLIPFRVITNTLQLSGLILFFNSREPSWIMTGAILLGSGMGGGRISWSLWVTRLAPPEKVGSYMSVHTAIAGLRNMLVPFLGYALLSWLGPGNFGLFAAGLIGCSSLMFLLVRKHPRLQRR